MNSNKELRNLKKSITVKAIFKIGLYFLASILILKIIINLVKNPIALMLYEKNINLYYFIIYYKDIIFVIIELIVFIMICYFVINKTMDYMVEIINSMDIILKEPEKEIKLSRNLISLENKLNKIRIDLIRSKNMAREAENKKNDLIVYMAHDLKTPLTSTIGYLNLLTDEKEITKELQDKYIKIALDKALRVEELTNQFFDITRYNLQDIPINKQNLDLSYLMEQLVDEGYPMLEEKNLKVNLEKPEKLIYCGDGEKLARAFGNLLKNAINYSYDNTQIEIVLQKKEKIEIIFKNKGEKIPEYKLDRIFEKFYRADDSRRSSTGGAGLGLAITKQIIELHGGKISVKNDDEYIEFYIEL